MTYKQMFMIVMPVFALVLCTSDGTPAALVNNGGFELTTNGLGQFDLLTQVTGWTSDNGNGNAYNLVFGPGTADTIGVINQDNEMLQLWGPGNGANNGLPATSPAGGNFIGSDPVFQTGPIEQMINGLTIGDTYAVSFYWAGAQQYLRDGPTTEGWQVTFGSQTQSTPIVENEDHGFTGWMYASFNFTADSASQLLSFLALGGPSIGLPPFVLLDGVTVNPVPEPTSLLLFAVGMAGLVAVRMRRRAKSTAA